MDIGTIVGIVIAVIGVSIFLFSARSMFKKKGKKEKGKKKAKESNKNQDAVVDASVFDKKEKKPKINVSKLKKEAGLSSKVEPAFKKEDVEAERLQKVKEEVEKNRAQEKQTAKFPFQNMPFGGNRMSQMQPGTNPLMMPKKTISQPSIQKNVSTHNSVQNVTEQLAAVVGKQKQQEDEAFVEILKNRGAIKKNQSFGESLMVKEAIDTPVAKEEMKKKRNKWM